MYESHPALYEPSRNYQLWQYMSFSKFVNLLIGSMYFRRIDMFEDVFEGRWPELNKRYIDYVRENEGEIIGSFDLLTRKLIYVSCFHKSDCETAFMWKQYSDNDGIAIKTSVEKLKRCFDKAEIPVYISNVKYIDYEKEPIYDMGNLLSLAIHKRKSFEFEKEVRCLCLLPELLNNHQINEKNANSGKNRFDFDKTPSGVKIPVVLSELIEEVYISPYADSYIKENVEVSMRMAGLNAKVIESDLYTIK